jgi:hypothetical protein|tara:strand:+ start:181 stop:402 length:222 start_codon:yes stop_codon:yes gene_type:complete
MRIDDLLLDELIRLHEIARENGYAGDYMQFKKDLEKNPEVIPFPPSAGPDFSQGGLVGLLQSGIGRLFSRRFA